MAKYQLVLEQVTNTDLETVPIPRGGHRCATDGVFLYAFGGFGGSGGFNPDTHLNFYRNILCFHLSSKRWYTIRTDGQAYPMSVISSVMVLHKGRLYVFGGSNTVTSSNKMFECDLRQQMWDSQRAVVPGIRNDVPTPGYGQGVVLGPNECMFIFGGTTGLIYNNDLHKYDFKTRRWELMRCSMPPSARYRHEMASTEGGFVVIGGYGINGACPLDTLPVYSYADHSWQYVECKQDPVHDSPQARRSHSCVKFKDNVYVCGGFQEDSGDAIYDDIWKLNVRTFTWSKIPQALPYPTYFHSAAVTKGCMYIFGGIQRLGEDRDERTNNVFKMWLVIPTLERLSWEALCDAIPHDRRLDTSMLGSLCVPKYLLTSYDAQFQVGLLNYRFRLG